MPRNIPHYVRRPQATDQSGRNNIRTELPYLTNEECSVFQLLNRNGWRIEQERLGEEWMGNALALMNYSE